MTVPQSIQDQEIRTSLKTLIRGLTQGNRREEYEGYKALYKIGAPAITQIKDAIFQSNWSKVKRPNEIRYVRIFSPIVDYCHNRYDPSAI
jgi:hypothetical protein